jgi:hypothetical protein
MKTKSILKRFSFLILALILLTLTLPDVSFAQSNGATVTANYGPPAAANTWEKFTIPLTAAQFNTDDATFQQVMSNVQHIRISTEFHSGYDTGSMDNVSIGTRFSSDFNSGLGGWSAAGDGTMEWIPTGGISGGHLQVADWASGDYHYAVTPPEWSGDWSNLIGSSLVFYLKTDQPSNGSIIAITSEGTNRLVLSADPLVVPPQGLSNMSVSLSPAATQDLVVGLSSSDTNCITVPSSVSIGSGQSSGGFVASAASSAQVDCSSVIISSASGYWEGRLTLRVGDGSVQSTGTTTGPVNTAGTNSGPVSTTGTTLGVCDPSVSSPGGGASASSIDWDSPAVQGCFEPWITEAMSLLNSYVGDYDFNVNKPYSINKYGQLEGRYLHSANEPDNFQQYNNNKYWWMWDHYTVESVSGWSSEEWRTAGVPGLRPYVRQCLGSSGVGVGVPNPATSSGNSLPIPPFGSTEPASVRQMTLQAGQRRVVEGDLVYVPIWLINGTNVANMNFNILYDDTVAFPEGDILLGSVLGRALFDSNTGQSGIIRAGFAQTTGLYGTGSVAYIPFRALGRAGDLTGICLELTIINDPSGTAVTIDRIHGAVQIVGPDGLVPGDCNNDGKLTQYDAFCALQMSVKLRPEQMVLDLDGDGEVTSRDATIILQQATKALGGR